MKEFPYFNEKLRVNEKNKIKWRESIFDKILKQVGPENDKYHVKYNQDLDIYYNGKDEKVIVKESSDKEVEQRRKRKRKSTDNMDEINKILKKTNQSKIVIYPTGTLLALKSQSWTKTKETSKNKSKNWRWCAKYSTWEKTKKKEKEN